MTSSTPSFGGYVWVDQHKVAQNDAKQKWHLVLADRLRLSSQFFGYPSWPAAAKPVWRCLRCDFDRCWVFVGDRTVPSMDEFLRFVASRVPFDPVEVLPRLAACTQIALSGPVVRLHAIYERFGGCVCEERLPGRERRLEVRFTADGARATITKPLRLAKTPGWQAPPGVQQVSPLRLRVTVCLNFENKTTSVRIHATEEE